MDSNHKLENLGREPTEARSMGVGTELFAGAKERGVSNKMTKS